MRYIGIDVGLAGAVAILPDLIVTDTPVAVVTKGKTTRRVYLEAAMADLLRPHATGPCHAILEAVHSMPKQGSKSVFSFGEGFGIWKGILAGLGIPYTLVDPSQWKRAMIQGVGRDKDASRIRAQQLFPGTARILIRKQDHGRAESLLLAAYLERLVGGIRRGYQLPDDPPDVVASVAAALSA